MALSQSSLISLNITLFDRELCKIQTKFNYFYGLVRTMFEELSCDCTHLLRATIDKALCTIEADIKSIQTDFHAKRKSGLDIKRLQSSWSDYKQTTADIEEETLLQCLHVHNTRSAALCKELIVLFPYEVIVKDIFVRAREMLRHRFCTYTL